MPRLTPEERHAHEVAARMLAVAAAEALETHRDMVQVAVNAYGNGSGVLIAGAYRDHFPYEVKSVLRSAGLDITRLEGESFEHWRRAGKRAHTWRAMYVSTRGTDRLREEK